MDTKIKDWINKNFPVTIRNILANIYNGLGKIGLEKYQSKIYKKGYFKGFRPDNTQRQLESKLTFHAHSLEKGLSHEKIRLGFGELTLKEIRKTLDYYNKLGFSKKSASYINALSVLNEYRKLHELSKFDLKIFNKLFASYLSEMIKERNQIGGAMRIKKANPKAQDFKELIESRWSVREYSDKSIDVKKIENSIKLAQKSPSACNRQSSRVHIVSDAKIIKKLIRVQGGFTGYKLPPTLLIVTSDTNAFLDITERNQPYIDGGIFSMSLLLALEYYGLPACPLNAMFDKRRDIKIRGILNMKHSELMIMFIAVGNFNKSPKVAKSFRLTPDEVIIRHVKTKTTI